MSLSNVFVIFCIRIPGMYWNKSFWDLFINCGHLLPHTNKYLFLVTVFREFLDSVSDDLPLPGLSLHIFTVVKPLEQKQTSICYFPLQG